MRDPLVLTAWIDGKPAGSQSISQSGNHTLTFPVAFPIPPGDHLVELQCSSWFVSDIYKQNHDYRPLSWKPVFPDGIRFEGG
jgi:hypothetical protein